MSQRIDLVVAVYKDDIKWAFDFAAANHQIRLLLYDKWDGAERPTYPGATKLLNFGKCDESYAHHLVEHYDDLADWTVFAPDSCMDGRLRGASMADALIPGDSLRVPRLWKGRDWGPDGRLRWSSFAAIPDRNGTNWADRYANGTITPAALSFVEWMKAYIGFDPDGPDWPGYNSGGVMAVPKRAIKYLPVEFYARLRDQLSGSVEPEEGHFAERAWVSVFSGRARYIPEESTVCVSG